MSSAGFCQPKEASSFAKIFLFHETQKTAPKFLRYQVYPTLWQLPSNKPKLNLTKNFSPTDVTVIISTVSIQSQPELKVSPVHFGLVKQGELRVQTKNRKFSMNTHA